MNTAAYENTCHPDPGHAALRLDACLQIKDVEAERHLLAQLLEGATALRIDIGGLLEVDTAGVQLLLAFKQEGVRRGVSIEYCGDSMALRQALTLLGLSEAVLGQGAHE